MKRAVIVHCWEGGPELFWYPAVKKELEEKGYAVDVPAFPEKPEMAAWVPLLAKTVGEPEEDMVLIGHSIGAATILRYLEQLGENEKVGTVIFVAGYTDDIGYPELKSFFPRPFDWMNIKKHADRFIYIYSDNDPYVPMKYADEFLARLGAKKVLVPGAGHFDDEERSKELPQVLEELQGV